MIPAIDPGRFPRRRAAPAASADSPRGRRVRARGFSVLEMLVVLGIVAALVVLAVPALTSAVRGTGLQQAADLLAGEIEAARGAALRGNRTVAFRFYRLEDGTGGALERPVFAAFQAGYLAAEDGRPDRRVARFEPIGPVRRLPAGTIVIEDGRYSPLVADRDLETRLPADEAPRVAGIGRECRQFLLRPDGTTNLDPGAQAGWFVTLAEEKAAVLAGRSLPDNFITIQIDPVTGNLTSHQPR